MEFTSPSKGKARGGWILRGNQQVDGEACAEASSTSEIFCCVYPQRISFAQGATHRIRKERFILQGYLCTWLFGFLPWVASAHTDNPKSLQYQQQPSSYTWVGFIRKNKAADCVFIQNYFNKALDTHQWLCIHHSQNLLTNIPTNIWAAWSHGPNLQSEVTEHHLSLTKSSLLPPEYFGTTSLDATACMQLKPRTISIWSQWRTVPSICLQISQYFEVFAPFYDSNPQESCSPCSAPDPGNPAQQIALISHFQ